MQAILKGESFLKKLPINQYEQWAIRSQGESEKILRMRRSDESPERGIDFDANACREGLSHG